MSRWTWDPSVLALLLAAAAAYAAGLRARVQAGRTRLVSARQAAAYYAGLAVLFAALVSPIDAIAEQLFSVHMSQHLLIGLVAPLLIVLGRPVIVMTSALDRRTRAGLVSMTRPLSRSLSTARTAAGWGLAAVTAHVVMFWVWHAPPLYDAAVRHAPIHAFEHLLLFATGVPFWWFIVGARWHERSGLAVLYLFLAGLPMGALAALLTLAPNAFYSVHATTTQAWHLTPLQDQELAGAVMWVPGGMVYAGAAVILFVRWLQTGPATAPPVLPANATRSWSPPVQSGA